MISRRGLALAALLAAGPAKASIPPVDSGAAALAARMRAGGLVLYIRHALTNRADRDSGIVGIREGQRNITEAGRAQARRLGAAFRALPVPHGQVLAGPVYRARDTAEFAFGAENVAIVTDLIADDYAAGHDYGAIVAAMRRRLATPPPPGLNTVLVGHRTPLEHYTATLLPDTIMPEGAIAAILPLGEGGFRWLGSVTTERLAGIAGV
ncbi:MAG: histidine phosphatase family protein [Acetobacteraceae bacterium]|jgi:phosphohistidine phosphatase SixA|nr:histidine phosphatase family protein [Acetobacteraceae bacterium]